MINSSTFVWSLRLFVAYDRLGGLEKKGKRGMTRCEKRAQFLRLTMSVYRQDSIRSSLDEMRHDLGAPGRS